jgi:heterodisulfide reductase subunit A-like polyferredoxin
VETGFSIEQAQKEARRCLSCRRCLGCGLCLAVCEPKAIVFDEEDEVLDLTVDQVILSPDAGVYMPLANGEFGYGTCKNVVSALQFQRILDEDGPYGGVIMRPFDGEIPEKIAFILTGNAETNEASNQGKDLLSFALQEASSALKKVEDLQISVFVSTEEIPGLVLNKEEEEGIHVRTGEVLAVKEEEDTKNLLVTFQEGAEQKQEEFGMVVLSKQPEIRPEFRALHEELGRGNRSAYVASDPGKDPDERE